MAFPIDSSRFLLIATSGARPGPAYAELADGSRRYVPGQQGLDQASGLPVWEVDAVAPAAADDERGRAVPITVRLIAQHAPQVAVGMPITFTDLEMRPTVSRKDNKLGLYWSAQGVTTARPAAVREAS